jgi:hypothetical protein
MQPGSLVVELFGALGGHFGDTTIYSDVCARGVGLQHVPVGVPGTYPMLPYAANPATDPETGKVRVGRKEFRYERRNDPTVARVDPDTLVALLRRVFPADPCQPVDWPPILREFNEFIEKQPNPNSMRVMNVLGSEFLTDPPQVPQYRERPWCNRSSAQPSSAEFHRQSNGSAAGVLG